MRSSTPLASRLARLLVLPAVLGAAVLIAGCGGSGSPANAAAAERTSEQQAEHKLAQFAACLREHGVNADTAGPGGGPGIKVSPGRAGSGPAAMEAAQKACARYRPEGKRVNLSPQQKVQLEEQLQKFAKCMREHGIKVEVSTQGGGAQIGIHGSAGGGGPNPASPGFKAAQNACMKLLPKPPGARRSGAPPGGPFSAGSGGSESGSAGG
jgi:hypothetical protein